MSAGGIVVRRGPDGPEILIGLRRRLRDGVSWTLPKGTPEAGETVEATALREVAEETGLEVAIVAPVGSIEYDFATDGRNVHKIVHHFLMRPTGGSLAGHDHEFEDVRWVSLGEADRLLTFSSERGIVDRAAAAIAALGEGGRLP